MSASTKRNGISVPFGAETTTRYIAETLACTTRARRAPITTSVVVVSSSTSRMVSVPGPSAYTSSSATSTAAATASRISTVCRSRRPRDSPSTTSAAVGAKNGSG